MADWRLRDAVVVGVSFGGAFDDQEKNFGVRVRAASFCTDRYERVSCVYWGSLVGLWGGADEDEMLKPLNVEECDERPL
jgi:hypothetical protein